jgi:hypothetical protein
LGARINHFGTVLRDFRAGTNSSADAKSVCKLGDVEERHVAERALNTADVGAMQIRFFRQALLGPTPLGAQLANALRKPLDGLICE